MCIEKEREALLQFKAALVDPYGMLSSWTTSDCCQWQGIRCTNLTGHVLMLDLHYYSYGIASQRYIRGEIHKSLMELQQLNYLNLSSNDFQFRGIPEFLGSLTNLRYLDLSHSDFEGKIPTQVQSHVNLEISPSCSILISASINLKEIYPLKLEISPSCSILISATILLKEVYRPNLGTFQICRSFISSFILELHVINDTPVAVQRHFQPC
ncbi:Putative LRR receptor-like serine/threonine-protein kinase MRH1 [Glycine soja]|uniref:Putative LRR receptor-like serine/threonine-protein kinase MRH1 n=1 Tax=Glycine soja TaxID=3848 RepID=A0A0B2R2L9_GLYSO|nr:Putative LRR receptor-like serine/threonine-protein kinase MRH1 [Glycine soja]